MNQERRVKESVVTVEVVSGREAQRYRGLWLLLSDFDGLNGTEIAMLSRIMRPIQCQTGDRDRQGARPAFATCSASIRRLLILLAALACLWPNGPARAQVVAFRTLVQFSNTNGATPQADLIQVNDGAFYYGTTHFGGSSSNGTIFKVTADGRLTTVVNFLGTNGTEPLGALSLGGDGNFYGTTFKGGSNGVGTLFQMMTNGTFHTLYSFSATSNGTNADGALPQAGLALGSDGCFYGTTSKGGTGQNGTVFKVTTNGTFTTLHSFAATVLSGFYFTNADGTTPEASLVQGPGGTLYGTAFAGGGYGLGTAFAITTNGAFSVLATFNRTNGAGPQAGLTLGSDGNFYGTTLAGGTNNLGTVFQMTPAGALRTLYTFGGPDGQSPASDLLAGGGGIFYGTTSNGGQNGNGTVFAIATNRVFTSLYSFSAGVFNVNLLTNADGATPVAGLVPGSEGTIYGTASAGGITGNGTVFELTTTPVPLNIRLIPGSVVLQWEAPWFSLQAAPAAVGTYTNILGAVSPYTNPLVNVRQFFRLIGN